MTVTGMAMTVVTVAAAMGEDGDGEDDEESESEGVEGLSPRWERFWRCAAVKGPGSGPSCLCRVLAV